MSCKNGCPGLLFLPVSPEPTWAKLWFNPSNRLPVNACGIVSLLLSAPLCRTDPLAEPPPPAQSSSAQVSTPPCKGLSSEHQSSSDRWCNSSLAVHGLMVSGGANVYSVWKTDRSGELHPRGYGEVVSMLG